MAVSVLLVTLFALASAASADTVIGEAGSGAGQVSQPGGLAVDFETGRLYVADEANHRIDVFDPEGHFAMAFGWGVANGAAEPQRCGPAASPPTATCRAGLAGGGAGEFDAPEEVAVDNDPSSASQHDVYVLDRGNDVAEGEGRGYRVQKLTPSGEFLLAFGGGVITAGATGSGNLSAGSATIANVLTSERTFEAGQAITAPGKIPAETTIAAVGPGTITLSKPATGSGTAVALSVAVGPGNVPVNEVQTLFHSGIAGASGYNLIFSTPSPSPTEASTGSVIPQNATAAEIQADLEALPNLGPGNVAVTGPAGGPYEVEFKGTRFANTNNVALEFIGSGGFALAATPNGDSAAEICTAAIAESCAGGIEGSGAGQFAGRTPDGSPAIHLATGPGGTVYVAECVTVVTGPNGNERHCENRLQEFEPSGAFAKALPLGELAPKGLAVDSGGDFYVSHISDNDRAIRKYDPSGNLLVTIPASAERLAIDAADDLFAAEGGNGGKIAEYDPAGNPLRRFAYGTGARGLAPHHSATGDLYVAQAGSQSKVLQLAFPPPGPLIASGPCETSFLGNVKATLTAEVNPEGKATTVHFQYVDQKHFEEEGFAGPATKTTAESASIGADFDMQKAAADTGTLVPETKYHCRVVATNADAGFTGDEGTFTTLEPLEIGATWASDVGIEAATLNATVNPLGIPTTAYFEYVEEATYLEDVAELGPGHGFDHAARAPEEAIELGAGESFKVASTVLGGLEPGTAYRYRIAATDLLIAPEGKEVLGPVKSLRTARPGEEGALPDGRAYELVSPALKNSAEVGVPEARASGGLTTFPTYRLIRAAAASGEAMTFTSWTSFADPEAAPGTSQYLARRGEAGWGTENISPIGGGAVKPPYRGFTRDLGFAAFEVRQPKENEELLSNLYLRDDQSGAAQRLTDEEPSIAEGETEEFCLDYAGASADGSRAFFAANGSYAGAPKGNGFSLYEWSAGEGLKPLSVLPGKSTAAAPAADTGFGAGGGSGIGHCESGETVSRNVVSADGQRAFWTYKPAAEASQLLVRIGGAETARIDKGPGGGVFQGANADGSKAFLTDSEKLKANSGQGDLYLYQLPAKELTDLTPSELTPGSEAAGVKGVIGTSEDGSYAYFVATGVLSGEEEGAAGERAEAGKDNLYSWHEGEGLRFIAVLSGEDAVDWGSNPNLLSARVSPDGQSLAFLSVQAQALAGYDNTIAAGAHCEVTPFGPQGSPLCSEAFLYDAQSGDLSCASCNPSGARPLGPSNLPGWSNPYEGPRYLSADGSKLFFESFDALSLADENGKRDVYEFEREGAGSCTSESPGFDPASGGCRFLLSGGRSDDESYLLDASSSGRDVFLSTRKPLIDSDKDGNYDIYDAREGGGFPEAPDVPICEGEGCKPPVPAPPAPASSPGTASFQGPGNAAQKPKKKKHRHRTKKHKAKKHKARHRGRAAS